MNEELTIDAIRDWLKKPVTIEFFQRISENLDNCNIKIHSHLSPTTINDTINYDSHLKQASFYNAAMDQLKEVLIIPELMIDELKENKEEKDNQQD